MGEWETFQDILGHIPSSRRSSAHLAELPFRRVWSALFGDLPPSPLDLAVLLRQALRFQTIQEGASESARLFLSDGFAWPSEAEWHATGCDFRKTDEGTWITARPWRSGWLPSVGEAGADASAAGAAQRRYHWAAPADQFLRRFGHDSYQSPGQRAAVRAALTTPPGATLLVILPTGEGKSLVFQAVAKIGFGDLTDEDGVVLVLTPTVTLALDHARAARQLGLDDISRAYVGGNTTDNKEIAERIANGSQGLCFASPEAACGPLRWPLLQAARNGRLRALVLDEAHLVEAWGGNFRPEFQILSGLRRDLLEAVGSSTAFRTFLLSATVTESALTTLQRLFGTTPAGDPMGFALCASVRLRPEIDYWVADPCTIEEQQARVLDALHYLPRPAILYVTERAKAESWQRQLHRRGYRRFACVTGNSGSDVRQAVVDGWKRGDLDLVVATSAFGLGIDNADVRTVIHACIPETLDRYYQEVGRGGRDGRASMSLVVPTEEDRIVARGLNDRRLITVSRGLERWQAMFHHPTTVYHGADAFTVRLDLAPGVSQHDIDVVGDENTQWNARTLNLMASAGLIALQGRGSSGETLLEDDGATAETAPKWHPIQTLTILDPGHLHRGVWDRKVEPERRRLRVAARQNLQRMERFLTGAECAADTLAPLYDVRDLGRQLVIPVAKACGGCTTCRSAGRRPWSDFPVEPRPPWDGESVNTQLSRLLGPDGRLVVFDSLGIFDSQAAGTAAWGRRFRQALASLIRGGARNLILLPGASVDLELLRDEVGNAPWFVARQLAPSVLPKGPTIIVASCESRISSRELRQERAAGDARFFFLPSQFRDPDRLDVPFDSVNPGRKFTMEEFLERINP